mgnify:CR=1 FL=1
MHENSSLPVMETHMVTRLTKSTTYLLTCFLQQIRNPTNENRKSTINLETQIKQIIAENDATQQQTKNSNYMVHSNETFITARTINHLSPNGISYMFTTHLTSPIPTHTVLAASQDRPTKTYAIALFCCSSLFPPNLTWRIKFSYPRIKLSAQHFWPT